MLLITVKEEGSQFLVSLNDSKKLIQKKRTHKSNSVKSVTIKDQGCFAMTHGNMSRRLADSIDEIMDAYEEETGDLTREINLMINMTEGSVYQSTIDYLIRSDFINHASVNGVSVR